MNDEKMTSEMKMVAHFMARKFIQDIERNPDKQSFIEFCPDKDFRKPHSSNLPWNQCNGYVKVYWNYDNWLLGNN